MPIGKGGGESVLGHAKHSTCEPGAAASQPKGDVVGATDGVGTARESDEVQ